MLSGGGISSNGFVNLGAMGMLSGNLSSGGNAFLDFKFKVDGNATVHGTLTKQRGAVVTGSIIESATVPSCEILQKAEIPTWEQNITVSKHHPKTLYPGKYGNLTVQPFGKLTLKSGVYNFKSFDLGFKAELIYELGDSPSEVNVTQNLQFGDFTAISFLGLFNPNMVRFYTNQTTDLVVGRGATFRGILTAPNAKIKVLENVDAQGAFYGDRVSLDKHCRLEKFEEIIHQVEEFDGNRAQIRFYWAKESIQSVNVSYRLNGRFPKSKTMPRPENAWIQVLDDSEYMNLLAGDRISYSFTINFGHQKTINTKTFTYVFIGPHKTIPGSGIIGPILPYDPHKPITLRPGDSRQYAFAIFTVPITEEQKAAMQEDSIAIVKAWSVRLDEIILVIGYHGNRDINDVAQSLSEIAGPAFYNLAPTLLKKEVLSSSNPTETPGSLKRVYVECFANVTPQACSTAVYSRADSVIVSAFREIRTFNDSIEIDSVALAKTEYEMLITPAEAEALSNSEVVAGLFEMTTEEFTMKASRQAVNLDALQQFENLPPPVFPLSLGLLNTGEKILVGIYDGKIWNAHPALSGRVINSVSGSFSDHGTQIAGIVGGDGTESETVPGFEPYSLRGIAPRVSFFQGGVTFNNSGERGNVTNHSHGTAAIFYYDNTASVMDNCLYRDYFDDLTRKVIVTTTSNEGGEKGYYSTRNSAKNLTVVGAYDVLAYGLWENSGIGPTRDGRIKPDVLAPGANIWSTATTAKYKIGSGTSAAAPQVTGIVALMKQWYRHFGFGCSLSLDCPAFAGQDLLSSTYKAVIIHTAIDLTARFSVQYNKDINDYTSYDLGPDFATGWGLVDALAAVNIMSGQTLGTREGRIAEIGVGQGETRLLAFQVFRGVPNMRFTIAWDDPGAGCVVKACATTPKLVNDIDLHLRSPSGQLFFPWKLKPLLDVYNPPQSMGHSIPTDDILDVGITASKVQNNPAYRDCRDFFGNPMLDLADGCYDHLNNVERVDVENPEGGTWTAVIRGRNVPLYQTVSAVSDFFFDGNQYGASPLITNLYVAVGNNPGVPCAPGHNRVGGNLKRGSNSTNYIYLCASTDPVFGSPITSITTIAGISQPATPTDYSIIPSTLSPSGTINADFNLGVRYGLFETGIPIFAFVSRHPKFGGAIKDVRTISGSSGIYPSTGYFKLAQDLSQGAEGLFHFITLTKEVIEFRTPITGLYVAFGDQNVQCKDGYFQVSRDLNEGARGHSAGEFIYLCATREISAGEPLTSIAVQAFGGSNPIFVPMNHTIVPSNVFPTASQSLDLNKGVGGSYVYVYESQDPRPDNLVIRDVFVISGGSNVPAPPGYTKLPVDLNKGSGGSFIYVTYYNP